MMDTPVKDDESMCSHNDPAAQLLDSFVNGYVILNENEVWYL